MSDDKPRPTFDPQRLREERRTADLGSDAETGHSHAGAGRPESDDAGGTNAVPPGATPPAR